MKSLLIITLFCGALYLCWQEVRLGGEYFWLNRASRASTFSPEQVVLLERAFRTEPDNFATCYAIGESFRVRSFEGGDSYRELAKKAMDWYARSTKLNPYDAYNYMRYGMCLDWLDRHDEAASYFGQANDLDPNGFYVAAHIGWHYVQTDDYAAARTWYLRSKVLQLNNNDMADSYLEIVRRKLLQRASNQLSPLAR
jgi:tetratricopeptide (TPR) repeat protein